MKNNTSTIIAIALSFLLAGGLAFRVFTRKAAFDQTVTNAMKTSEGYDVKLINIVRRLEEELALRASFGYLGGKDPMTGKMRVVVMPTAPARKPVAAQPGEKAPVADPVKLTAIIYDDERTRYTAVVMDGERSYSVEVGDRVRDRRITRITEDMIYMENAEAFFAYDIFGKSKTRNK